MTDEQKIEAINAAMAEAIKNAGGSEFEALKLVFGQPEFSRMLDEMQVRSLDDDGKRKLDALIALQRKSPERAAFLSNRAAMGGRAGFYVAAAKAWLEVYASDGANQAGARAIAVSTVLGDRDREADDPLATDARAATLLAKALQQSAKIVLAEVEALSLAGDDPNHATALDGVLCAYLKTLGELGQSRAKELVAKSGERRAAYQQSEKSTLDIAALFRLWTVASDANAARFAVVLSEALWLATVRPELQKLPAMTVAVMQRAGYVVTPGLRLRDDGVYRPSPHKRKHGHPLLVADPPTVDASLVKSLEENLPLAGSMFAWPLIEWLVETAHELEMADAPYPNRITVTGGWRSIAAQVLNVGDTEVHGDQRTKIRTMAWTLARLPVLWSDGGASSALFLIDERDAQAGRGPGEARVTFTLGDRLLPGETFRRRKRLGRPLTGADWTEGRLVPVLRPRVVPPIPGSAPPTYGAQAHFVRRLWLHFVEHGEQLSLRPKERSGIEVQPHDKRDMAAFVQLPERLTDRLFDHLVASEVVVKVEGGASLYRPADDATVDFIRAGAQGRQERSEGIAAGESVSKKTPAKPRKKLGVGYSPG